MLTIVVRNLPYVYCLCRPYVPVTTSIECTPSENMFNDVLRLGNFDFHIDTFSPEMRVNMFGAENLGFEKIGCPATVRGMPEDACDAAHGKSGPWIWIWQLRNMSKTYHLLSFVQGGGRVMLFQSPHS